jgi:hypothetical protein
MLSQVTVLLPTAIVTLVMTGTLIRTATIFDDDWREGACAADPCQFVEKVRRANIPADVLTFAQKLVDTNRALSYPCEPYNLAVAPTGDYDHWWEKRLPQETRKHVWKALKLKLVVREIDLDDDTVRGLKAIYDESPIRQGRRFWHYGKPPEVIRRENSSYLDRSILLGAFHEAELVGFMKLVRVGAAAHVMQLIAKAAHSEKKPSNALIAKAVQVCGEKGISFLAYGQYVYGKNTSAALTEFKRRNGFEMVILPRYYVPLTIKGRCAVRMGFHRGLRSFIPDWLDRCLRNVRAKSANEINRHRPGPVRIPRVSRRRFSST